MSAPGRDPVRLVAWVHGHVQGVGFRWWTRSRALELGLSGYAANKPDGRVHVVAEGDEAACSNSSAVATPPDAWTSSSTPTNRREAD